MTTYGPSQMLTSFLPFFSSERRRFKCFFIVDVLQILFDLKKKERGLEGRNQDFSFDFSFIFTFSPQSVFSFPSFANLPK